MKTVKNNLYMLRLFFRAAPLYAVMNLVFVIANTINFSILGSVVFLKYLADSVETLAANPKDAGRVFASLVAATLVYYACVLIFNTIKQGPVNHYLKMSAEMKVRRAFLVMLSQKSMDVDLKCYDDPEYYQNMLVANQESNSRAWAVYRTFVNFADALASGLVLLTIVINLDIAVFILAVVIRFISFFLGLRKNRVNFQIYQDELIHNRRINYVNRVFFERQYAKDLKLTDINHVLFDKLNDAAEGLLGVNQKYGKRKAALEVADRLNQVILGDLATLLYLAYRTLLEGLSFGSMAALWNSYNTLKSKTGILMNAFQEMHEHSIYIERFLSFAGYQNEIRSGTRKISDVSGAVSFEFKNVTFGYDPRHPVLKNFNLTIRANERLAIVGSNGAGKSTLVKLLLRLYDPDQGTIYLNGVDIREFPAEEYRKKLIGFLPQNFRMYAATLAENVKMDRVSEENTNLIEQTMMRAGIWEKIKGPAGGIETEYSREFSKNGVVFSGGERQKLAMARLLYATRPCIVLDEPSAALDPKSEHEMNQSIFYQAEHQTIVIISHRLSTTKMADRIIYIEDGRIEEDGSHEELMAIGGKYAKMFKRQAKMYQ